MCFCVCLVCPSLCVLVCVSDIYRACAVYVHVCADLKRNPNSNRARARVCVYVCVCVCVCVKAGGVSDEWASVCVGG